MPDDLHQKILDLNMSSYDQGAFDAFDFLSEELKRIQTKGYELVKIATMIELADMLKQSRGK